LLALPRPAFQQLDNRFLHLLGRVGFRKLLFELLAGEGDFVQFTFFVLRHDGGHDIKGQLAILTVFGGADKILDLNCYQEADNVSQG
jgi:hypothetical protein